MATFVRIITTEEDTELRVLADSDDEVARRRALCILMSSQGKPTSEIGAALALSERSARNMINAFNKTGIQSVPRARVSGRPRRLASVPTAVIQQVVMDSPHDHGMDSDYWSLEALAAVLGKDLGIESLSADTLGREMKRRGLDWLQTKREHACSKVQDSTMDAQAKRRHTPQPTTASADQTLCLSESRVYSDRLLSAGERETYEAVIGNLRKEFSACGGIEEMHIQLAAVYFLRLAQAQAAEDWSKAEHLDRMLKNHLMELRAAKKKQETQVARSDGGSPAEWATELLERLAAEETSDEKDEVDGVSTSDPSSDDMGALVEKSYAKWKESRGPQ